MALRIDQLTAITASNVSATTDLIELHDTSAGGSRKISLADAIAAGASDYVPSSFVDTTSDGTTGNVTTVQTMYDGNFLQVEEAAGIPGFETEFVFSGIVKHPKFIVARWLYDGAATHFCTIDIYNYTTVAWDEIRVFKDSGDYYASMTQYMPIAISDNYISSGAARVRFIHHTTGNTQHFLRVDYVGLTDALVAV